MITKRTFLVIVLAVSCVIPNVMPVNVSAQGIRELKYLVVLFEFEDLKHTKSVEEMESITVGKVQAYYDEVSYGKVKVIGELASKEWINLGYSVKSLDLFQWNFKSEDMYKVDSKARDLVDVYARGAEYSTRFIVYAGKVWGHAYSGWKMSFQNEFHTSSVYCHELGHILGLPDLYSYVASQERRFSGANVGYWDLMSYDLYQHLSAWSKLKLEWIEKQQIVDVRDKFQGAFVVDAIENKSARLFVVRIYLTETLAYYVEVRARLGVDAQLDKRIRMGVLIFRINGVLDPKEGGVVVMDSHPNSYPRAAWAELFDAPFSIGRNETAAFVDKERNLSIIALKKIGYSCKIMIVDAATGEKAVEANSVVAQAEEAISKAANESRLKGLDEAKAQFQKATVAYEAASFQDAVTTARKAVELAEGATKSPTTVTTSAATTSPGRTETGAPSAMPSSSVMVVVVVLVIVAAVAAFMMSKKKRSTETGASPS